MVGVVQSMIPGAVLNYLKGLDLIFFKAWLVIRK